MFCGKPSEVVRLTDEARAFREAARRQGLSFEHKMLFLKAADERCERALAIANEKLRMEDLGRGRLKC
jgi:hypothetical protein